MRAAGDARGNRLLQDGGMTGGIDNAGRLWRLLLLPPVNVDHCEVSQRRSASPSLTFFNAISDYDRFNLINPSAPVRSSVPSGLRRQISAASCSVGFARHICRSGSSSSHDGMMISAMLSGMRWALRAGATAYSLETAVTMHAQHRGEVRTLGLPTEQG